MRTAGQPSDDPADNPRIGLGLACRAGLGELLLAAIGGARFRGLPTPSPSGGPNPVTMEELVSRFPLPPRGTHGAGGVRTTLGLARGNLLQKLLDQRPRTAGRGGAPPGFERVALAMPAPAAPLHGLVHPPAVGRPVVFLLHGLFDSKQTRYALIVAEALAAGGSGVIVPDLRWHGELYSPGWLSSLGHGETADLLAWGRWANTRFPDHPLGLLGFSLGSMTLLLALAAPEAGRLFLAGGLAFSPPADLAATALHLDHTSVIARPWGRGAFPWIFRQTLRDRLLAGGLPRARNEPFRHFLGLIRERHGLGEDVLEAADPRAALAHIARPVLLIASEDDPVFPPGTPRALAEAANTAAFARVIATPRGGHIGHLTVYPGWVSALLSKYFDLAAGVEGREAAPGSVRSHGDHRIEPKGP